MHFAGSLKQKASPGSLSRSRGGRGGVMNMQYGHVFFGDQGRIDNGGQKCTAT